MTNIISVGIPSGRRASSCGYCSPPGQRSAAKTSHLAAGLEAVQLSCEVYQKMIDRGWRRSGVWCYKPDLRTSCCPQYTIKLDVLAFKPSKSQRKLINRWNRFILSGNEDNQMETDDRRHNMSRKSKNNQSFSLTSSIHSAENAFLKDVATHRFEIVLEPSSYTPEKYALYKKYQMDIHHDVTSSPSGFNQFLVETPLQAEPIPYPSAPPGHLPKDYGSYHQLYRVDGQLIAMAVLDILPYCVSSVYFMYDKVWEGFSLGKLSALREASLARELQESGAPQMSALYMGFYIHSCQKMRYKGDYSPSYLADPETHSWFPLTTCIPLLDKFRYACFDRPTMSIEGAPQADQDPSSDSIAPVISDMDLQEIQMVINTHKGEVTTLPVNMSPYWDFEDVRRDISACIHALGVDLSKDIILDI